MRSSKQNTRAFLYRWTQKSTGMWYEGSRTAVGCHPEDGYLCSSVRVKKLILSDPSDWIRTILVMGDPRYIRDLEHIRLVSLNAKTDPMSYNMDHADGKFSTTGVAAWNKGLTKESDERVAKYGRTKQGQKSPLKGRKLGKYSEERVQKAADSLKGITPWNKGKLTGTLSDEHRVNISNTTKGVSKSEEHKQKQRKPKHAGHGAKVSAARKGKIFLPRLCRIEDRVETDVANYSRWLKKMGYATPNT